ncbi:MAG: tetratricopeptide repeat protein, partial [Trueperaceae bacterium]|nr:tetratricopeptide repeat protein [Trueperaceae bacterium]
MYKSSPQDARIEGLSVDLLGVPTVRRQNQAIHLGTRKALALLAYLALKKGAVARAELDILLWPDHDSTRARRSLRDELSRISKVVGRGVILAAGQNIQINSEKLDLDLWLFDEALENERFGEALSFYKGPLLDGLYVKEAAPFETWLEQQRELYEQKYLFALEQMAKQAELIEDFLLALHYYRKCLHLDVYRETCYYEAIRLLLLTNDRAGALKMFEDWKKVCLELSIEPDPRLENILKDSSFRPKSKDSSLPPPNNLPANLTSFVGREELLNQAKQLLSRTDLRLLTLTGPGGVGKTRLSLQLARDILFDFKDGLLWLELAPLRAPEELLPYLAKSLEVKETQTVTLDLLTDAIKDKYMLLIFDNFEHLSEAAKNIHLILKACPHIKVLVTSRVSLKLQTEFRLDVPPLDLPDRNSPSDVLAKNAAIELFKQRAIATAGHLTLDEEVLTDLAELCIRLDGLPLAIELAAARMKLFSPKVLLKQLAAPLRLLSSDAVDLPDRHKTLWHTLMWSYAMLSQSEQRVLNRLGIFPSSFGFEAAEALCADVCANSMEILSSLIDKSMVQRKLYVDETRFSLLESIREFCVETLSSNELEEVQARHANYYLELVLELEPKLGTSEQVQSLERLDFEQSNIGATFHFFEKHEPDMLLQITSSLWHYWVLRGQFSEGRAWLEKALSYRKSSNYRAKALNGYGALALQQGELDKAKPYLLEAMSLWQEEDNPTGLANALNNLGILNRRQGDLDLAEKYYLRCLDLRRELGNRFGEAAILRNLGSLAIHQKNWQRAKTFLEQALELSQELGEQAGVGSTLSNLGLVNLYQGDIETAIILYQESLELNRLSGDKLSTAISLGNLGVAFLKMNRLGEAEKYFKENLELSEAIGDQEGIASALEGFACIFANSKPELAAKFYGKAAYLRQKLSLLLSKDDSEQLHAFLVSARQSLGDYFDVLAQAAKY